MARVNLVSMPLQPITNPIELGLTEAELERRTGMKTADVTGALASYVRTIRSGDSRLPLGTTSNIMSAR